LNRARESQLDRIGQKKPKKIEKTTEKKRLLTTTGLLRLASTRNIGGRRYRKKFPWGGSVEGSFSNTCEAIEDAKEGICKGKKIFKGGRRNSKLMRLGKGIISREKDRPKKGGSLLISLRKCLGAISGGESWVRGAGATKSKNREQQQNGEEGDINRKDLLGKVKKETTKRSQSYTLHPPEVSTEGKEYKKKGGLDNRGSRV